MTLRQYTWLGDITSIDDTRLQIFEQKKKSLSPHVVEEYGKALRKRGTGLYFKMGQVRVKTPNGDVTEWVFPKLLEDWDDFDHIRSKDIQRDQSTLFLAWDGKGSCGPDSIIAAGLLSGAVIRKGDAIQIDTFLGLSLPQRWFWVCMTRPWAKLESKERSQLRDLYAKSLQDAGYASDGGWTSVCDLVECTFRGLPSFSYRSRLALRCCGDIQYSSYHVATTRSCHTIRHVDLFDQMPDMVQKTFEPNPARMLKTGFVACPTSCTNEGTPLRLIMDRLPPYMIFSFAEGLLLSRASVQGVFQNVTLRADVFKSGTMEQEYEVRGMIVRVGGNHFCVRWKTHDNVGFTHFDGLDGELGKKKRGWTDGLSGSNSEVMTVFYRQLRKQ
jgi:hypothetical protein